MCGLGFVARRVGVFFFFFFSSRRRHTRFDCDWSSDVCSSDLSGWSTRARAMASTSSFIGYLGMPPPGESGGRANFREALKLSDLLLTEEAAHRSEEHTSELQSQSNLVCRLLLEKKKRQERTVTRRWPSAPTARTSGGQ